MAFRLHIKRPCGQQIRKIQNLVAHPNSHLKKIQQCGMNIKSSRDLNIILNNNTIQIAMIMNANLIPYK
ncbi:hypothetical protein CsSME_00042925 [Camellia sinensis var. sinensis]